MDAGRTDTPADEEPAESLSKDELDVLTGGLMTIRDQEPLDDGADWANAVLALLADERAELESLRRARALPPRRYRIGLIVSGYGGVDGRDCRDT